MEAVAERGAAGSAGRQRTASSATSRVDCAEERTCQTMKARLAVEKSERGTLYLVTNRRTGPNRSRTSCGRGGGEEGCCGWLSTVDRNAKSPMQAAAATGAVR